MTNRFFNYKELSDEEKTKERSEKWVSKYLTTHFEKVVTLEESLTRIPTPEEFFFLQSDSSFNAFTFIPLIVKRFQVKELYASTYSISKRVINSLIELHDSGKIEQVNLLISDSMIKRNPVTLENLMAMSSTRGNLKVMYAWTHAKVCLMRTDDNFYVVEGSGNWSENAHYEQYLFANSKSLYDFRLKLFTESKLRKYQ